MKCAVCEINDATYKKVEEEDVTGKEGTKFIRKTESYYCSSHAPKGSVLISQVKVEKPEASQTTLFTF